MGVAIPNLLTEDRVSGAQIIDGSLRFDSSKSHQLRRLFSSGNRKTFTLSLWVKRSTSGTQFLFTGGSDTSNRVVLIFDSDRLNFYNVTSSSTTIDFMTIPVFRDFSSWYHIQVLVDTTQSTSTDRVKIYVNGQRITSFSTATYPNQNVDTFANTSNYYNIGNREFTNELFLSANVSNYYLIDGQALEPEYFGYTDPLTNTWRPKKFSGVFSTPASAFYQSSTTLNWGSGTTESNWALSNSNKTATYSGSNAYSDVFTAALNSSTTYTFKLNTTVSDSFGGWFFTDSTGISGTHPNERSGNSLGLRSGTSSLGAYGTYASANSVSDGASAIAGFGDVDPVTGSSIDMVINMSARKVWVRSSGASSWIGGGDPSNSSSTASFLLPSGTVYFAFVAYTSATITMDTLTDATGINSFYLPFDGSAPIGQDQSGNGNNWTPVNFGGSMDITKATGALPILNTDGGGKTARPGVLGSEVSKYYTLTGSSGAGSGYVFENEGTKPTLAFHRGATYTFDYTAATSHPLYLSSLNDGKHNAKAYSVEFNGTSQYLTVPASSDFDFGSGDFTVEWFQWWDNAPATYESAFGINYATNPNLLVQSGNGTTAYTVYMNGTSATISESTSGPTGEWVHYAIVRSGSDSNNVKIYRNGTVTGQGTYTGNVGNGSVNLTIGYDGNYYFDGKISNFRMVKGTAVYTSEFNPPSTTLTNISGTVLLCCQDSAATTAAVIPTGSITGSGSIVASNAYNPFLYNIDNYFGVDTSTSNVTKMTVPHLASDTLYYYCSVHSGMGNSISVVTDTNKADPYAWKNVLALPLVGSANDVSNSVNNGSTTKAITVVGGSFSSVSNNFYGGSYLVDANDEYLQTSSTPFTFGSGDYTIEYWCYLNSYTNARHVISSWEDGGNLAFYVGTGGASGNFISSGVIIGGTQYEVNGTANGLGSIALNKWTHVAICREGTNLKGYVDGVLYDVTDVGSGSVATTPTYVRIGRHYTSNTYRWDGYIQDVRIYKGVAKYSASVEGTQAFIPASTDPDILPDTPSGVSYSSNVTAITDGAVAFDGSGDYLSSTESSDEYDFPNSDWTIEYFSYCTSQPTDAASFSNTKSFASGYRSILVNQNSGNLALLVNTTGSGGWTTVGTTTNSLYVWRHIALVRNSGTITFYVDGNSIGSTTDTPYDTVNNDTVYFGRNGGDGSGYFGGFISNARIIKGTALYTSNFTPPTRTLTAVANTKLLCCQSNITSGAAAVSPNISGINDGTVWSSLVSGSTRIQDRVANAFNGSTSGPGAIPAYPGTLTFAPGLTGLTTVKIYGYYAGSGVTLHVNGSAQSPSSGAFTLTISTSTLDSIVWTAIDGFNYMRIDAIEIDSTILIDPVVGPDDSNEAATNFNPFTVNINAVRGQESGYCTLNPLTSPGTNYITLSNGNLDQVALTETVSSTKGTVGVTTGKWYWECNLKLLSSGGVSPRIGICRQSAPSISQGSGADEWILYMTDYAGYGGRGMHNSTLVGSDAPFANGDVGMFALDMNSSKIYFGKNGIWLNGGNPVNGSGAFFTDVTGEIFPLTNTGYYSSVSMNFGQKPFKFPPPAGFQPLALANLPRPSIVRPDQYVGIVTFSGTATLGAGTTQTISGFSFSPDLIWVKARTTTATIGGFVNEGYHVVVDTVRGRDKILSSNSSGSELTNASTIPSFNRDGFDVGYEPSWDLNMSGDHYVAWSWKAGGNSNTYNIDGVGYATAEAAGLSGGDLTITGASVGTKQGFSIIQYVGNNSTGQTVKHGLTQKPDFIMVKNKLQSYEWMIYHRSMGATYYGLFAGSAFLNDANIWADTEPTNEHFYVSVHNSPAGYSNGPNGTFISYIWHDVPGLQKFGSYTGVNSADGPFLELGFRPAVIMFKNTTTTSTEWVILDNRRNGYNGGNNILFPSTSGEENATQYGDFLSNGFKFRINSSYVNAASNTYIYAAWAEAPTFNLYGAQANAR